MAGGVNPTQVTRGTVTQASPLRVILSGAQTDSPSLKLGSYSPTLGDVVSVEVSYMGTILTLGLEVGSGGGGGGSVPGSIPIGGCIWSPVSLANASWLLCNGSTFSATTYPALNTLLGGNTLPNLVNYSPAGTGLVAAGATAGATTSTGLISHTHTGPSHSHSHSHSGANGAPISHFGGNTTAAGTTYNFNADSGSATDATAGGTGATGSAGSGSSFSILNPITGGYWLMRAN